METESEPRKFTLKHFFVGLVVGLTLAFVCFLSVNLITSSHSKIVLTPKKTLQISITSPLDNLATSEKTVTFSGNTGIKSIVTVSSGKQSKIVETSGNDFSTTLDLSEGKNAITIVAFDPTTGESQTKIKNILYLNEDLTSL